jgi:phosphate transport system protein
MSQLSEELHYLKTDLLSMIELVKSQFTKGQEALLNNDYDLANEVLANEKRVNACELQLDKDCEKILALYNPVAVDLRFVLATFKMNSELERIGDNAESIANFIKDMPGAFSREMIDQYQVNLMYDTALSMFDDAMAAFTEEDTKRARKVFQKDDLLDDINYKANKQALDSIKSDPGNEWQYLTLLSIVRKLERVGDQSTNMAEEIIFYIEAKVLKHKMK